MAASELLPALKSFEDGEPRVRDLDLAVALGYANPPQIRELIKRRDEQLEEFGIIRTVRINTGERGAPATEFWLTEKQALLLCTYAETQRSDEVRIALVNVFIAYKSGKLAPTDTTVEMAVLDVQKRHIESIVQQALWPIEKKIDSVETKVDNGFKAVLDKLSGVSANVEVIADDCKRRRRSVRFEDRAKIIDCLRMRSRGICPCCHMTEILGASELPNDEFQIEHFFGRHQAELKQVWPVCRTCNQMLENTGFRQERQSEFIAWQHLLAIHLEPSMPLLRGGGTIKV